LFSFNLGVELGQIGVAAVVLATLALARRFEGIATRIVPACSAVAILLGAFWFIERVV
jgi:hypothetical protein